jgi:hypothetical protein
MRIGRPSHLTIALQRHIAPQKQVAIVFQGRIGPPM